MLAPWLALDDVADRLRWYAAVTGLDLGTLGTTGTADEIRDTAVAQPLLVALALAVAPAVTGSARPDVVAGHSVGEFAAAVTAGALSPETALVLVRERGRLMADAAALRPTGMSALLGGDAAEVTAALERRGLTAANVNGAGQIVAAGTLDDLAALAAEPPAGARVRPLPVAGAFHTSFMEPARGRLAGLAAAAPAADPVVTLLGNADGAVVTDAEQVLDRLVAQVAAPVRWDLCMQTLRDIGVTAVLELPPAGTLTGLVRRALPDVENLALKSPEDLPAARALVDRHTVPTTGDALPGVAARGRPRSRHLPRPWRRARFTGRPRRRAGHGRLAAGGGRRVGCPRWCPRRVAGARRRPRHPRPADRAVPPRADARMRHGGTLREARITGLGEHRPTGRVTNADLAARGLDTTDEWIRARTGIASRHVAGPDESVVTMGSAAAAKALAAAGSRPAGRRPRRPRHLHDPQRDPRRRRAHRRRRRRRPHRRLRRQRGLRRLLLRAVGRVRRGAGRQRRASPRHRLGEAHRLGRLGRPRHLHPLRRRGGRGRGRAVGRARHRPGGVGQRRAGRGPHRRARR